MSRAANVFGLAIGLVLCMVITFWVVTYHARFDGFWPWWFSGLLLWLGLVAVVYIQSQGRGNRLPAIPQDS